MKSILKRIAKLFVLVSYPIILIALVVFVVLFVLRNNELGKLNNAFDQAQIELNGENSDRESTIDNLRSEFEELTSEVTALRQENTILKAQLEKSELTGYGSISGAIFPFVTAGTEDFSQYQRICAELVDNQNKQICRTVAVVERKFTINLPVGTYRVYAELFPTPSSDTAFAGYKAYYTEFIACVQTKAVEQCDANAHTPLTIEVTAGEQVENVDPIDWQQ